MGCPAASTGNSAAIKSPAAGSDIFLGLLRHRGLGPQQIMQRHQADDLSARAFQHDDELRVRLDQEELQS